MDSVPKRRHERLLLALALIVAIFVGFWLGRISAPDSTAAYERGRQKGQQGERRRAEQSKIDLDILRSEVAASRSSASDAEKPQGEDSIDPAPSARSGASN